MIINLENNKLINRAYYVKASLKTANGSINYKIIAISPSLKLIKKNLNESGNLYKNFLIYSCDFLADNLLDIQTKGELMWQQLTKSQLDALAEFENNLINYQNGLILPSELANNLGALVDKLPKFDIEFLK